MKDNKNTKVFNAIALVVLLFQIVVVYLPCIWGIMQTFKSRENWMLDKLGFPKNPSFRAYEVFFRYFYVDVIKEGIPKKVYFEEAVLNTVLFAGGTSIMQFLVVFTTSYVVFKYSHFKASGIIYATIIIALNLPLQGGEAASLKLYHRLGLYDSMIGMWLLSAHPLNFQFLLYYAAFSSIPKDLFEAAEMDGASRLRIMIKIALPLVGGMVLLQFMNAFITSWNNYQTCLMYMPSYPTVGYALYKFNLAGSPPEIAHSTVKLTGAFICALPIIVAFCFLGNKMMNGVSMAGGVKG